jgi:hypothetical protein
MSDLIGASSGSRASTESTITAPQNAQAFSAEIKDSKEALERGGKVSPDDAGLTAEERRKQKSQLRKILRKTVRQQVKHYVLMNHLQQIDLDAAYQTLARQLGSSTARKAADKP